MMFAQDAFRHGEPCRDLRVQKIIRSGLIFRGRSVYDHTRSIYEVDTSLISMISALSQGSVTLAPITVSYV